MEYIFAGKKDIAELIRMRIAYIKDEQGDIGGDERTHHVHIFGAENKSDIERHIAVRDYLRSHKEVADEYGELKARLALEHPYDNDGYCDGKDAFVKDLEQKALAWQAGKN